MKEFLGAGKGDSPNKALRAAREWSAIPEGL